MPTTLRDYLASLPAAGGTLDADDTVAALEDGTLVGATPAQLGAGGGGAPSGPAGGVLGGTYPNPSFAVDMATQAELNAVAGAAAGGVLSGTYPNPGFAADMATQAELDAHVTDTTAAHAASAVSYAGGTGMSATDVEAAIDELATEKLSKVAAGAAVEDLGAVEFNVNTVATSGSTETLDTSVYGVHDVTMDQACTFTFSNPAPSGKASEFVLILRGAFTPTLPASVDWPAGSAPTYTTPSVYVFSTVNAGTVWLGRQIGAGYA